MSVDPVSRARHQAAVRDDRPTYTDATTGYEVFTDAALRERGYCCQSGCRHCPYGRDRPAAQENP